MNKAKDLINWGELSRRLSGSRQTIRKNKIPIKHQYKINELLIAIDKSFEEQELRQSNQEIYKAAIKKYGVMSQVEMAIEECSELIQAIQKTKRSNTIINNNHVCEELADVEIMIEQLRGIYDPVLIDRYKAEKIERLEFRIINE